ncbi:hypothetical protein [Nocardia sp. NPDC004711]
MRSTRADSPGKRPKEISRKPAPAGGHAAHHEPAGQEAIACPATPPALTTPTTRATPVNAIYRAGDQPGELITICELPATATAVLTTRRTGSRDYLAGTLTVDPDVVRTLLQLPGTPTCWALWDGTYIRIRDISITDGGAGLLRVDQSTHAMSTKQAEGGRIALRIVEPSPPQPVSEWVPAERERALADHHAATAAGRAL